jgi:hypothetical protein
MYMYVCAISAQDLFDQVILSTYGRVAISAKPGFISTLIDIGISRVELVTHSGSIDTPVI